MKVLKTKSNMSITCKYMELPHALLKFELSGVSILNIEKKHVMHGDFYILSANYGGGKNE